MRWANVVGHFKKSEAAEHVWWETDYRILQCPACEAVYFQKDSVFSEDVIYTTNPHTGEDDYELEHKLEHWPSQEARPRPDWLSQLFFVDPNLEDLLSSVYEALDKGLGVLSAIGIRTAFDRASELLEIDPSKSFKQKLTALQAAGKIGQEEQEILDTLTDAGSAAAHRGWKPSAQELDTMMSIIEAFVYRSFILGDAAKRLKEKVPAKPARASEKKVSSK